MQTQQHSCTIIKSPQIFKQDKKNPAEEETPCAPLPEPHWSLSLCPAGSVRLWLGIIGSLSDPGGGWWAPFPGPRKTHPPISSSPTIWSERLKILSANPACGCFGLTHGTPPTPRRGGSPRPKTTHPPSKIHRGGVTQGLSGRMLGSRSTTQRRRLWGRSPPRWRCLGGRGLVPCWGTTAAPSSITWQRTAAQGSRTLWSRATAKGRNQILKTPAPTCATTC